jgi:ABC-type multidrug transport system fused ATPase/permease subunit
MERERATKFVHELLELLVKQKGSDLFITAGFPPAIKVDGKIAPVSKTTLTPQHTIELVRSVMNDKQAAEFEGSKECNFAIAPPGVGRFRCNAFVQQGRIGMVMRTITTDIPKFEDLGLPPVLKDVIMSKRGIMMFVGATGAGKSTFAKLVARFYDPTDGRVLVDGHDLRTVRAESLRSQMGIVPQEAFLFSGTVGDNIAFGRPDATAEDVEAAARAVGAWEFIEDLPDGLDTEVGERGAQLSAGQRQLVAFARALIADPRILVLDEATSNVDLHTEGRIEAGLRRLLAGRTAIVIAHRLSTIRQAGRIVVLDQGRVVEQGTHEDLLEAGGPYERLYRDWAEQAAA